MEELIDVDGPVSVGGPVIVGDLGALVIDEMSNGC